VEVGRYLASPNLPALLDRAKTSWRSGDLLPNSKTNLGLQIFHHSALIVSATHPTSLIFI
jgi:hypothetical protein